MLINAHQKIGLFEEPSTADFGDEGCKSAVAPLERALAYGCWGAAARARRMDGGGITLRGMVLRAAARAAEGVLGGSSTRETTTVCALACAGGRNCRWHWYYRPTAAVVVPVGAPRPRPLLGQRGGAAPRAQVGAGGGTSTGGRGLVGLARKRSAILTHLALATLFLNSLLYIIGNSGITHTPRPPAPAKPRAFRVAGGSTPARCAPISSASRPIAVRCFC
jgi:hypothetical protein